MDIIKPLYNFISEVVVRFDDQIVTSPAIIRQVKTPIFTCILMLDNSLFLYISINVTCLTSLFERESILEIYIIHLLKVSVLSIRTSDG